MSQTHGCAQQWQAEAIEDGRLSGAERVSFERHAALCEVCSKEIADLARIREIMTRASAVEKSPLERKRLRMDLLRRADGALHPSRTFSFGRAAAFAMAAAACALLAIFGTRIWLGRPRAAQSLGAPAFDVAESGPARWSNERRSAMAHVDLSDGALWIHVARIRHEQRFVLTLPDGEIEVLGTRFLASVADGTTRHVEVAEGVVALRLIAEPVRVLRAGDVWDRPIAEVSPGAGAAAAEPGRESDARPARSAHATASPETTATEPPPDPFVAGVQAFRRGDFAAADDMLAHFVRDMPSDPRIEDALFLRAVANGRLGRNMIASDLARAYLARFPKGLRRPEAARIAAQGGQLHK